MRRRSFISLTACLLATGAAHAQEDQGVYAPEVPKNYAFVRILDITGRAPQSIDLAGEVFQKDASGASSYRPVPPGKHDFTADGRTWTVDIGEAKVITIAIDADGADPIIFEDVLSADPSKANVALYNFTKSDLSLTALSNRTVVLDKIAPAKSGLREINSVTIDLYVQSGDATAASFVGTALQRRTLTSYFAFERAGAVMVTSQVDRTRV